MDRIDYGQDPITTICHRCNERKPCAFFVVTNSGRCDYVCDDCTVIEGTYVSEELRERGVEYVGMGKNEQLKEEQDGGTESIVDG